MYYPEEMKARVSPVQWSKPHSILSPTQDSNPSGRIQNHKRWPLHYHCSSAGLGSGSWLKLSKPLGSPMNRRFVGLEMRYGTKQKTLHREEGGWPGNGKIGNYIRHKNIMPDLHNSLLLLRLFCSEFVQLARKMFTIQLVDIDTNPRRFKNREKIKVGLNFYTFHQKKTKINFSNSIQSLGNHILQFNSSTVQV